MKDATMSIHFDGNGDACLPGFHWICSASSSSLARSSKVPPANSAADDDASVALPVINDDDDNAPWKIAVNAYVSHFRELLAHEYIAEKDQVLNRTKRSLGTLQTEGYGCGKLRATLEKGRIIAHPFRGVLPVLSEIHIGREVLLSGDTVALEDATKTISGEVSYFEDNQIFIDTTYSALPQPGSDGNYRLDLGPNTTTFERMDKMIDSLQRCEGPSKTQQKKSKYKMGLLLPNTLLSDALFADINETSVAALKWDPVDRQLPNSNADISKAARKERMHTPPYKVRSNVPSVKLNESQWTAVRQVVDERRRLTFIQGPPGTGKTTTAAAIVCHWLQNKCGPILCTAFSNKGTDHLGLCLHKLGIKVVRVGISDTPFSIDALMEQGGYNYHDQDKIIDQCDVVCATCIGSGMSLLRNRNFPFIVMDEAAQVIEPASLIPLSKGCVSCVLVGDQCQLPPTVISDEANRRGLGVSMFDRLINIGMQVHMLDTQYRMHPAIASFSSWRFYRSELRDGVFARDRPLPIQSAWGDGPTVSARGDGEKSPVFVVNVDARESSTGASKSNKEEAHCVATLVEWLSKDGVNDVGVITPYSAQVNIIRQQIRQKSGLGAIQVSSVDAFQGSEREVIICSMVRANDKGNLGFVSDWRRLNVALTRGKSMLILVCHIPTMSHCVGSVTRDMIGFYSKSARFFEWDGRSDFRKGPLSAELQCVLDASVIGQSASAKLPSRKDKFVTLDADAPLSVPTKKQLEHTQEPQRQRGQAQYDKAGTSHHQAVNNGWKEEARPPGTNNNAWSASRQQNYRSEEVSPAWHPATTTTTEWSAAPQRTTNGWGKRPTARDAGACTIWLPAESEAWPMSFNDDLMQLGVKFNISAQWTEDGSVKLESRSGGSCNAAVQELNEMITFYTR
eukprot:GEMP01004338.1.p1 GENE.GEMP01004338.1~~GEMP01004338.1.p1  ORF type:complete len:906 (+),score=219.90 GEMP01004338.1:588-3305(+)